MDVTFPMNSKPFLAILTVAIVICSCNPWRFALQQKADYPIEGRILSNKNSVEVYAENAVRITSPASVAIRSEQITDGEFNTEVKLLRGSGFDVVFRSTPFDDSTNGGRNKLAIRIYRDTSLGVMAGVSMATVTSADTSVTVPITLSGREAFTIVVTQQGVYADVVVACSPIGRFKTSTPSTQWISIKPAPNASIDLIDPLFRSVEDLYYQSSQDLVDRFNNSVR